MNLARAAGPALGGLVVNWVGAGATFLLNAVSFLAVFAALLQWQRPARTDLLPPEELIGAMRAGLRYVRHSPTLRTVMLRTGAFVLPASALWALLPLYARAELGLGPAGYGVLLGFFGSGAVCAGLLLPWARARLGPEGLATGSTLAFAGASAVLGGLQADAARGPAVLAAGLALFVAGAAWLALLSMFNAAAQIAIPSWVRARAMAAYMLVMFGSLAAGSALFGALAGRLGIRATFLLAAAAIAVGRGLVWRRHIDVRPADLTPAPRWPDPQLVQGVESSRGPVLVTVEYEIDPADAEPFALAMRAVSEIRLRDGALRWGLWADAARPGCILESFIVESWVEHLRQHERITAGDRARQATATAFHRGSGPPRVTHFIHERMPL
jgi:hypothetical protein